MHFLFQHNSQLLLRILCPSRISRFCRNWETAHTPQSTRCVGMRTLRSTPSKESKWEDSRPKKKRTPSTRYAYSPPSTIPTSSGTNRPSSTSPASPCDSIVMEFASNGDLAAKIAKHVQQGTQVPEETIWNIFINLVKGLKQLHDLHIFHRDIKTANVFLHEGDGAKLGDMNVSKISEEGLCVTQTGTPYYASPEVWKDQPYDEKSDIWSLGCVLYELICLKVPFKAEDMEGLYKKVTRGIYPRIPPEYSQELSSIIRALLQVNPEQRPSCEKILKMAVIQKHMVEEGEEEVKCELLRTIKAETFQTINENLPKANYQPLPPKKKPKGLKAIVESIQQKELKNEQLESICQIESLPILQKDKKIYPMENSDRVMSKDKLNVHLVNRDRKKSQMGYSRSGLQPNALNSKLDEIKELKLPKVQNRYNRTKEKGVKHNQNSLRCYKIFEC